ncbi:MAG: tRNA (adenosine(37)-N6)-threonylcarbamoyltransferase complex ATPase subunit type 1 TsaE [Patescibacteria group bacterium]
MTFLSHSDASTRIFAARLAKETRGGAILGLIGDLGGGKTTFAKGFARGLGIPGVIASPTFILLKIYPVHKRADVKFFCHVDAYRVRAIDEIAELGLFEWLGRSDTITLIEWADRIAPVLRRHDHTEFTFDFIESKKRRISQRRRLARRH